MIRLNLLSKIFFISYIFFYLITPKIAISRELSKDIFLKIENSLNKGDLESIYKYFKESERTKLKDKYAKIRKEFQDINWKIKKIDSSKSNKHILDVRVSGSKKMNESKFILESNFNFIFSFNNGMLSESTINNNLTTIRNDKNKIDLNISIPDKVLTGSNYDLDIILNEPLDNILIAGGLKEHNEDSIFNESILLEPLVSGGIFKVTRAPTKPGTQVWSGIIAHPKGLVSFTKSVAILEKF